jgi:hypothetical protein
MTVDDPVEEIDPPPPPARRFARLAVVALVVAAGSLVALRPRFWPRVAEGPGFRLELVSHARTGHQRAERLVFLDGGRRLAVSCPRYGHVVIYRIVDEKRLERRSDVKLDGRPVALAAWGDRLIVLQRPSGDARHVEPAWWDVLDAEGRLVGSRFRLGFDPDDLAVTPDGQTALVLLSGRAEGEPNRPAPCLAVVKIADLNHPRIVGSVPFEGPADDPERLSVDFARDMAAVTLRGSNEVAWIDVSNREQPRIARRQALPESHRLPGGLELLPSGAVRVSDAEGNGLWEIGPDRSLSLGEGLPEFATHPSPDGSPRLLGLNGRTGSLEVRMGDGRTTSLPLVHFGEFRPTGLAVQDLDQGGRMLVAFSDRSGAIGLVRLDPTAGR